MLLFMFALTVYRCEKIDQRAYAGMNDSQRKEGNQKMIVIGHRGAAGLAPENTISAFKKALDLGVDGLEMDVLLSLDGEVVVHHDFSLKPEITRTKSGEWLDENSRRTIKNLTLLELKTYDVGRLKPFTAYSRRYPGQNPADGERIPTLREVIHLLISRFDSKTELWIEIKTSPEKPELTPPPEQVVDATVKVLSGEGMMNRSRILSFDWRALVYCRKIYPDIPVIFLSYSGLNLDNIKTGQAGPSPWTAGIDVDDYNGSIPLAIHHAGGKSWGPHFKSLRSEDVMEAHRLGIRVYVWTPDEKSDMERVRRMHVDGIITNRPDLVSGTFMKD